MFSMLNSRAAGRLVLLAGLLTVLHGSVQAATQSYSSSESRVKVGSDPVQFRFDPSNGRPRVADGFSVRSGVENFASFHDPYTGTLLAATANARFSLEAGLPRMELLTANTAGTFYYPDTFAYAAAGGVLTITGTVHGTPGARGLLTFDGGFAAAVSPANSRPLGTSGAVVDFIAGLALTGPGQSACPAQRCLTSDRLVDRFENGSLPAGGGVSRPFSLSLEATVGDRFELSFMTAATASNGYYVLVGPPPGVPSAAAGSVAALDAGLADTGSFAGISGVRLSNGLGLSADSGLVLQADGRWTLPSPVPEPAVGWLLGAGLAVLWLRRRTENACGQPNLFFGVRSVSP